MKVMYRILFLAGVATAQETTAPSDMPSDVPSYVPTPKPSSSPSTLPTINNMGPYPPCPICPEGQEIENPDAIIPTTDFNCAQANQAGLMGNIDEERCSRLQGSGPLVCGCSDISPTMSPVADTGTIPPPSTGECSTTTCAEVNTWLSLDRFVQAAASGDKLCMCGRSYGLGDSTCGPTIVLNEEKDISLECVENGLCSYECPDPAFYVTAGSLTLTGNDENFKFTGGESNSRVVVGEGGTLMASQIVFEDTASKGRVSGSSSRHLQSLNTLGGGLETYGTTTVANSRFENCTAVLNGGAVYMGSGSATFTAVTFRENSAYEGAGIYAVSGSLVVTDSLFEGNTVTNTNTDPDLLARAEVDVDACDNTADSDGLDTCSGAGTLLSATSMALAMGLAMALFA